MKDIFTKDWLNALVIRLIKTFAEGCIAVIGTSATFIGDVNWMAVLSGGCMAAVFCFLFSLAGLPEVGGDAIEDGKKE